MEKTEFTTPTAVSTNGAAAAASPNDAGPDDDVKEQAISTGKLIDPYSSLNLLGDDEDDYDDDDGPELVTVRALTGKPPQYFRVNPDPAYTTTGRVVEYEPPGGADKEIYFVLKSLWRADLLVDDIRKVRFYVVVDQRMNPFIWPVKIADGSSDIGDRWATSAKDMAHLAMEKWIKIKGNKAISAYEPRPARMDLGEPHWPEGKTLNELLLMAYGSKYLIDSIDHPVINKL